MGNTSDLCHEFADLSHGACRLTVFRALLNHGPFQEFVQLLTDAGQPEKDPTVPCRYGHFVAALYETHTDLGEWILDLLMESDNVVLQKKGRGEEINPILENAWARDLALLQRIGEVDSLRLKRALAMADLTPDWTWGRVRLAREMNSLLNHLSTRGYGIFAKSHAFSLQGNDGASLELTPIRHPDYRDLSRMIGYHSQRDRIRQNLEGFLSGQTWQNMLLYGEAGTGKSSTIKAFAWAYRDRGLRIVQVSKHQLHLLPALMAMLSDQPLKFILFIDDLTFSAVDDAFTALKTTLEGGLLSQGRNVVIFATTNRRHLLKETLGDREGDLLHVNDGLQETMGLAGRFGLTIIYERPDKADYQNMVQEMAKEKGIEMPLEELLLKAEAFAIRCNGRSPRVACQFMDSILLQSLPLPPEPPLAAL